MKTITNKVIESFLQCKYKSYLQFNNESGIKTDYELVQNEITESFKKRFSEKLHTASHIRLLSTFDFQKKIQCADGLTYVIAPSVQSKEYKINFDAVEISLQTSSTKIISHIPITISPKGNVSKCEKLSFAVTCLIVSQLQHTTFEFGKIIYGVQSKSVKLLLSTYLSEAQRILRSLRKTVHSENAPRFYHNDNCKICEFQKVCRAVLIEKDDLSLLGRISEKEVLKRNDRGFFTIQQLSYTYRPRRKRKNPSPKNERFLWELKSLALREQRTFVQELPKLPKSVVDVYLDFEGLPDEHFHYLIGMILKDGETERQMSFWANSQIEEEAIFRQLFETLSQFKKFTVYHYGSYELRVLKKLNKKFKNKHENDINRLIQHSVNILSLITPNVYFPTYTNELKEIAKLLGFTWTDDKASGIQSIVWRKRWEFTHNDIYKSKLVQYNIEDCLALQLIKEWLEGIVKKIEQESNGDVVKAEDVKTNNKYPHTYCRFHSLIEDFEKINAYAYFDYQREKIFLKTNTRIKKAIKRGKQKRYPVSKVNKIVKTPHPQQCPQCHHDKLHRQDLYTKTTYDLKFIHTGIKKWVTQTVGMGFRCPKCRKSFVPESNKHIYKYGHNLMSWAVNQHIAYRISGPNVAQIISESFGIPLTGPTITNYKNNFTVLYLTFRAYRMPFFSI